jgi:hypothetical protein
MQGKVAIVGPAQPMDHRDISKTVNRACVVRVVGEAAISTPSRVVVSEWCVNNGQNI